MIRCVDRGNSVQRSIIRGGRKRSNGNRDEFIFHLCLFEYALFLVCVGIYHIHVIITLCIHLENAYEPVLEKRYVYHIERIAKRITL